MILMVKLKFLSAIELEVSGGGRSVLCFSAFGLDCGNCESSGKMELGADLLPAFHDL